MLTVTASEARANFSKLGEEITRTGKPVTVFKNSKPWLVMMPAQASENRVVIEKSDALGLSQEELNLLAWADTFIDEYHDVFEVLAK